ncbi:hypothetical protein R6Z07F_016484 [Ovis aries]
MDRSRIYKPLRLCREAVTVTLSDVTAFNRMPLVQLFTHFTAEAQLPDDLSSPPSWSVRVSCSLLVPSGTPSSTLASPRRKGPQQRSPSHMSAWGSDAPAGVLFTARGCERETESHAAPSHRREGPLSRGSCDCQSVLARSPGRSARSPISSSC